MHGRDFSTLLTNPESKDWEHATLFTHMGQDFGSEVDRALRSESVADHAGVPYFAAVVVGNTKYVRYLESSEPEELYNLLVDPEELVNLADDPVHREVLERLRAVVHQELLRSDATFIDLL